MQLHRPQITVALGVGMFVGVLLPSLFGAYTAMSFTDPTDPSSNDLVTAAPSWYVMPIVVISLLGGQPGVLCIYASGLDLEGVCAAIEADPDDDHHRRRRDRTAFSWSGSSCSTRSVQSRR